jgi:hypothetical protein
MTITVTKFGTTVGVDAQLLGAGCLDPITAADVRRYAGEAAVA